MADASAKAKRLSIRKYPNRRYYDATRSRHLTLEEIYRLIQEGWEVEVTDSKTGQDITAKVLAQIILDLDAPKLDVFPVPLLHRLLRTNQEAIGQFIEQYFNQPLAAFLRSQKEFEQHLRRMMGVEAAGPTMADWARMMWGPLVGGAGAAPEKGEGLETTRQADPGPQRGDPRELSRQVEELKCQMEALRMEMAGKPKRRK